MRKVRREELVDYATWAEDFREAALPEVLATKAARRLMVDPAFTFLFENADTIRWQVQEMMRVEQIVKEANIDHELKTYNELIGDDGEIGCVLLIEIDDEAKRDTCLTAWLDLPRHLYAELEDGTKVRAIYDPMQVGDTRLSSVQYLKFATGGAVPVAIGSDHPDALGRTKLPPAVAEALAADLS